MVYLRNWLGLKEVLINHPLGTRTDQLRLESNQRKMTRMMRMMRNPNFHPGISNIDGHSDKPRSIKWLKWYCVLSGNSNESYACSARKNPTSLSHSITPNNQVSMPYPSYRRYISESEHPSASVVWRLQIRVIAGWQRNPQIGNRDRSLLLKTDWPNSTNVILSAHCEHTAAQQPEIRPAAQLNCGIPVEEFPAIYGQVRVEITWNMKSGGGTETKSILWLTAPSNIQR